jgi:hypothetical protein
MEKGSEKINSVFKELFRIKDKSDQFDFKKNLISDFGILKSTTSKVWKRTDYDHDFINCWLDYFHSQILATSEQDLWLNLGLLKPVIDAISDYDCEGNDFVKFILCFIVDSICSYEKSKIDFFTQKLTKPKAVTKKDPSFIKHLKNACVTVIDGCRKTFMDLRNSMTSVFADKIRLKQTSFEKAIEGFYGENFTALSIKKISTSLFDSYVGITKDINDYNETEDDFMKIKENDEHWTNFRAWYNESVDCLDEIKLYENIEDFCMKDRDYIINEDFKNYLKITYSKNIPYDKEPNTFNECEKIITDFLTEKDFKRLFEDICMSKVIKSFYSFEYENYFPKNNEEVGIKISEKDYYILLKDFPFFWDRVKVIPLPENIVGVTTDMLVIYINLIQKKFFNIANEEEKKLVNLFYLK